MGLVQREIEAAGMATVTISNIPDLTAAVSVPRLVAVEHPMSRTMGNAGDSERQLRVLRASLTAVAEMGEPGDVEHLPYKWRPPKGEKKGPRPPYPPIVNYLVKHPWLYPRFISRDVPEAFRTP